MTTLYGIPNCNQIKKARDWLGHHQVDYTFHDFKKQGLTDELIRIWLQDTPWEKLINRQGTTWRTLSEELKVSINDPEAAILLMLASPAVIKRPVLHHQNHTTVGFSEAHYHALLLEHS